MQAELKKAIKELEKANNTFEQEKTKKYGQRANNFYGRICTPEQESELYVNIVGAAWKNYLNAGGSLTGINN